MVEGTACNHTDRGPEFGRSERELIFRRFWRRGPQQARRWGWAIDRAAYCRNAGATIEVENRVMGRRRSYAFYFGPGTPKADGRRFLRST